MFVQTHSEQRFGLFRAGLILLFLVHSSCAASHEPGFSRESAVELTLLDSNSRGAAPWKISLNGIHGDLLWREAVLLPCALVLNERQKADWLALAARAWAVPTFDDTSLTDSHSVSVQVDDSGIRTIPTDADSELIRLVEELFVATDIGAVCMEDLAQVIDRGKLTLIQDGAASVEADVESGVLLRGMRGPDEGLCGEVDLLELKSLFLDAAVAYGDPQFRIPDTGGALVVWFQRMGEPTESERTTLVKEEGLVSRATALLAGRCR